MTDPVKKMTGATSNLTGPRAHSDGPRRFLACGVSDAAAPDQLDPQLGSDTSDDKVLDTVHRGEPSKRPDKQPASLSVSVNIVSQTDGACAVEGQFSDAESMEDGTQLSSTMLMSSSTAGSTEHGSSWYR